MTTLNKDAIAVVHLPPPVSGLSFISAQIVDALSRKGNVSAINISGGTGSSLQSFVRKFGGVLAAVAKVLISRKNTPLYITAEGGRGLIYTILVVAGARLRRRRIFIHHHSYNYINQKYRLMQYLISISGKRQINVFLSKAMKKRFERIYGEQLASHVVSNCAFISPIADRGLDQTDSETIVLGHLSNLMAEKGVLLFLDLVAALVKEGRQVKAVLAGTASDSSLQKEIGRRCAGLADVVEYRGSVYGAAKDAFYRDIDVFIFPTQYRNEAQPAVVFEAMSAGIAVVSYDRGCISEQIESTGQIVPQGGDFAQELRAFLAVYAERRRDGTARTMVTEAYERQREIAEMHLRAFVSDMYQCVT